jgi:pimeloyl-ACP methyl ester carboxylesterase
MAARNWEEDERRKRRRRLWKGLLVGGAAIGIPALANYLIQRRAGRPQVPAWGRSHRYAWRHGEILFQRLGEGPPLVLVHSIGPGHDGTQWQRAAEIPAQRHTVLVPDLLGFGRSEKPPIAYDGELYIQLLSDFLHDVASTRAALVAAGLPAAYAVQLGVDQPETLSALGLVVPVGVEVHGEEPDLKDAVVHRALRLPVLGTSALNAYTSRSGIAHHLRELYAAPERVDAALVDHHYRSSHQPGGHAPLAAFVAGYLNHYVEATLSRLTVPTWLAWGRRARSPVVESADLWLHKLPHGELEVFEQTGNLPHAEAPTAFCAKLEDFLARLA